jgi:hypothetical protein
VPGQSTTQDVQAAMGEPRQKLNGENGASTWFYPTGYFGFNTYAVRVNGSGVVQQVEQTLTPDNLAKLQLGRATKADVLAVLGPSSKTFYFPRNGTEYWDYRMINQEPETLTVQFSKEGVVQGLIQVPDSYFDGGSDHSCPTC